ncbi:MAG TPA: hypothetical protein VM619_05550 [Luteimonas sp.]|nr:hypothetical protein [Luteimonas sp.]
MRSADEATAPSPPACPACGGARALQARRLAGLLREDDLDAAIDAGLMEFVPCPECAHAGEAAAACALVAAAQARLLSAWAARDRHHARDARLQRRAAERAARRAAPPTPVPGAPALPPAAAAALARAKARAAKKP